MSQGLTRSVAPTSVAPAARREDTLPSAQPLATWRTPAVVIVCGCVIAALAFGPRSTLGFFLTPMSSANHWGRDVFAFALAVQNLLWGAAQPVAGAIADRFGATRVLSLGALLYALGLVLMAHSNSTAMLDLSAGALLGFGLSGTTFPIVLAAFGKILPAEWRATGFGLGTAAGSFGQFLFSPLAVFLIDTLGWRNALVTFGVIILLVLPFSIALASPRSAAADTTPVASQSMQQALSEAFGHRSYVLLMLGFLTCGFQIAFISVHLPAYLADRGLSSDVGGWTLAAIGLFNIVGALGAGWLSGRMPKRYLLSLLYFGRAAAIFAFIMFPITAFTCIVFGATMGLMWLSTVPPTNGIIVVMFGTRWLAGRRFFQPPGRRFSRRLARRHCVRPHRFLRSGLVVGDPVWRTVRADQSADRRGAGSADGAVAGMTGTEQ